MWCFSHIFRLESLADLVLLHYYFIFSGEKRELMNKENWLPKIAIYQRKKNLIIKTDWLNSILREEFLHQVAYCTRWCQRSLVAEFLGYLRSSENHAFHDIVLGAHTSPLPPPTPQTLPFSHSCSSHPIPHHSGLRLLYVAARLSIFLIPFIPAHTSKYHPFFW